MLTRLGPLALVTALSLTGNKATIKDEKEYSLALREALTMQPRLALTSS